MRVRTRSACVVLAWGILLIVTAVGSLGSLRTATAPANIRIASSISNTTSNTHVILTSRVTSTAAGTVAGARPATGSEAAAGYVVQPGDTLSGIAAATGVRGGWPALYAANRTAIGPDPGLIRPGTVLTLPGRAIPARYRVAAGDTLSGIAAALGTSGGWPALYAANQRAIGNDPNVIRAGIVLTIPRTAKAQTAPVAGAGPGSAGRHHPAAASPRQTPSAAPTPRSAAPTPRSAPTSASAPASAGAPASAPASTSASVPASRPAARPHRPASASPAALAGLPRWLEIVLLAAGLLIVTAFLTEPTLALARRLRASRSAAGARIVLADYDRLVVTHCGTDGTVYVLRPPGADPEAILLAARLVLAQDRYEELAGHLGVPAHWPRE